MKVMVISTGFMNIAESFQSAFMCEGWVCDYVNTSEITSRHSDKKLRMIDKSTKILDIYREKKPDLVLDLLGANLSKDALLEINRNALTIKYMLDLVENYIELKETMSLYNLVYTYESYDIKNIQEFGAVNVELLYATYDDLKFYPIQKKKDIDVCFVGQMFTPEQKKRREILHKLIKDYPELKVAFYGVYARPYQAFRYLKWRVLDRGKKFKNVTLAYDKVNEIYNRSKICLNINSFQTYETWSSRLLEMMGTESCVITDKTRDIESLLGSGVVTFSTYEELKEKIKEYLNDETIRKEKSKTALQVALQYTINKTVLQLIQSTKEEW